MVKNEKRPISSYSFTPVAVQDGYEIDQDSTKNDGRDDRCGVWCCKSKHLQFFARPLIFLAIFCLVGMIQGAFFTYFIGVITTVEKRYAFKSKITGVISIADNLSPILTSLLIGFFGGSGHRPRWIAIGTLIAASSAVISSLPYFIFGPTDHMVFSNGGDSNNSSAGNDTGSGYQMCKSGYNTNDTFDLIDDDCDDPDRTSRRTIETIPAVSLLFIGNFINGIGSTAFYIVGVPYLDDNVQKEKTPLYFAVMYSIRLLGPAIGFVLSSVSLRFYEDPLFDPGFDKVDPRWIGAWWIGFNIIALLLLLLGCILFLFPKEMKWKNQTEEQTMSTPVERPLSLSEKAKEFPKAVRLLFRNPILMFGNASTSFYILGMLGYVLFLPKYIESQFRQTASKANVISGLATVAFMAIGFIVSGLVIYKLRPSPRKVKGWSVFLGCIQVGVMIGLIFVGCSHTSIKSEATGNCTANCQCTYQVYSPVCHKGNDSTYFSPCHAGCKSTHLDSDDKTVFADCGCIDEQDYIETGYCGKGCDNMMLYILVLSTSKLITSTGYIGNSLITLRCVSPEDKSLALSTGSLLLSIFAFIPYPLVYGAIVDSACIVWEQTCGQIGNCWIYDEDMFRQRLHGFTAVFFAISLIFDCIVYYYCKNIKSLYEDPESRRTKRAKPKESQVMVDALRFTWSGSGSSLNHI